MYCGPSLTIWLDGRVRKATRDKTMRRPPLESSVMTNLEVGRQSETCPASHAGDSSEDAELRRDGLSNHYRTSVLHPGIERIRPLRNAGPLSRQSTELSEKRRRAGAIRQRGEDAQRVGLADRQPSADGIWIDADSFELVKQPRKLLFL